MLRFDYFDSDWLDRVCHGWYVSIRPVPCSRAVSLSSGLVHGSPERSRHGHLSDLSAFAVLSTDRCSCWYRAQSESIGRYASDCLAVGRRQKSTRVTPAGQVINCSSKGSSKLTVHPFSVRITTSVYPVPSICRFDQLGDWFESLADILHWNLRKSQLNLDTDQSIQQDEQSLTVDPPETKSAST